MDKRSPNGDYEFRVSSGYLKDGERVEDGVTLLYHGDVQFEADVRAPSNGAVANNGISAVIEGKNWDKAEEDWNEDDEFDTLYIFDAVGGIIAKERFQTAGGIYGCAIDGNGRYVVLGGPNKGNTVIYDVEKSEQISNRSYEEITLAYEIETVEHEGAWYFKLIDQSEGSELLIDTQGKLTGIEVPEPDPEEDDDSGLTDVPIVELLEKRGWNVPDRVYYLYVGGSNSKSQGSEGPTNLTQVNDVLTDSGDTVEEHSIYSPDWSDNLFVITYSKLLFVVGPESDIAAADALKDLESIERIEIPTFDGEESSIDVISPSEPTPAITAGDEPLSLNIDVDAGFENVARTIFYGEVAGDTGEIPEGFSADDLPENELGEIIEELLREQQIPYEGLQGIADEEPTQIVSAFPLILDLLELDIFPSYTIDSRSSQPEFQSFLNIVAEEDPDVVLQHIDRLQQYMESITSETTAEMATHLLQALIEEHPHRYNELEVLIQDLVATESDHPLRRGLHLVKTAIWEVEGPVEPPLTVEELIGLLQHSDSAWTQKICCEVLNQDELSDGEYNILADNVSIIVDTLRRGGDRRGENIFYDGGESTKENRNLEPSSEALYRLHRASASLLKDVANARPEALLPHLNPLVGDLLADGPEMKVIRQESKYILKQLVQNLPEQKYDTLSEYDSKILPLLQSEDQDEAVLALEWARRSRSQPVIDVLVPIHEDSTHPHWQDATAILEDLAPDQLNPETEPNNARADWISFVTELAEERGCLPKAKDIRRHPQKPGEEEWKHPNAPDSEYWDVFEDSWQGVLDALEIETERRAGGAPLRGQLINELQQLHDKLGKQPISTEINNHSDFSYYDYKEEFGGINEAREAADLK